MLLIIDFLYLYSDYLFYRIIVATTYYGKHDHIIITNSPSGVLAHQRVDIGDNYSDISMPNTERHKRAQLRCHGYVCLVVGHQTDRQTELFIYVSLPSHIQLYNITNNKKGTSHLDLRETRT